MAPAIPMAPANEPANLTGYCLFVYNIDAAYDERILWQLFAPFGPVLSAQIVRDFNSKKPKGYGFVTVASYESAVVAINALNGFVLGDKVLQVSFKNNNHLQVAHPQM
jgi:RNA recognition motif-containing protein